MKEKPHQVPKRTRRKTSQAQAETVSEPIRKREAELILKIVPDHLLALMQQHFERESKSVEMLSALGEVMLEIEKRRAGEEVTLSSQTIDRAGCLIMANTWIKVGLSRWQARRLKDVAASMFPSDRRSARAAWVILNVALSNIEIITALIRKEMREIDDAELYLCLDSYWENKQVALKKAVN